MTDGSLDKEALGRWIRAFQGSAVDPGRLYDPSRGVTPPGDVVRRHAAALPFESEPALFANLLHDLAPADLKAPADFKE